MKNNQKEEALDYLAIMLNFYVGIQKMNIYKMISIMCFQQKRIDKSIIFINRALLYLD